MLFNLVEPLFREEIFLTGQILTNIERLLLLEKLGASNNIFSFDGCTVGLCRRTLFQHLIIAYVSNLAVPSPQKKSTLRYPLPPRDAVAAAKRLQN